MKDINFKEYLENFTLGHHLDGMGGFSKNGGAYLQSSQTGSSFLQNKPSVGNAPEISSMDYALLKDMPTQTVFSTISHITLNKNPIKIKLEDGTDIMLSYDQYKKISLSSQEPKVGKKMKVVFQKNENVNFKKAYRIVSVSVY